MPNKKLDFSKTLAFGNFTLEADNGYRGFSTFSDINSAAGRGYDQPSGFFELFNFFS